MNIFRSPSLIKKNVTYYKLINRCLSSKDNGENSSTLNDFKNKTENAKRDSLKQINNDKIVSTKESKEAAKKKLLDLLSEIKIEERPMKSKQNLNLIKPLKRPSKKERFEQLQKSEPVDRMKLAIKAVASSVPGDPNTTEAELSEKLNTLDAVPKSPIMKDDSSVKTLQIDDETNNNLMASIGDIASTVLKTPSFESKSSDDSSQIPMDEKSAIKMDASADKTLISAVDGIAAKVLNTPSSIKSKLTHRLLQRSLEGKLPMKSKMPIDSLVKSMKVERSIFQNEEPKPNQKTRVTPRIPKQSTLQSKYNLFMSPPLGIFSVENTTSTETCLWDKLQTKNMNLLVQYAPENGFEEMIMWTEQGKHWKFPIDNETEMGEEENVGFHEHIFLEKHLHGFPTKGPIRHFMELVCVGLSKNPYITVDRKIENINWFRNYFEDKEKAEILQEYGALS